MTVTPTERLTTDEILRLNRQHTFFSWSAQAKVRPIVIDRAEANENALRMARIVTGRQKVIARYRSYHGATAGAISATGDPRRWANEPGVPGIVRVLDPYRYGNPEPDPVDEHLAYLDEVIQYEGPHTIAAFILETVTGTNGILIPPDGYLQGVRELCDRYGIMLIADEVMAGFGRTGRWFAVDHW